MINEIERLPDISFIEGVTLDSIKEQLVSDYQDRMAEINGSSVTLKDGEPVTLMLYACAVQLYQMYLNLDKAGRMNFLKYAYGGFLDNLGALKGVLRTEAASALCTVRFTLSAIRASVVGIPAGTRVTNQNADVYFYTDDYAEIPAGSEYVDVTCTCVDTGAAGNGFAAGSISVIVDPVPYVASCVNITDTSGGIDKESDDSLRERIYLAPANWAVAGPENAYIYFVKTAYSGVADVRVSSPSATEVDIRVIGPNGTLLSSDVCQMIEDYLENMGVRPQTDSVSVDSPTQVTYNIAMTYYINRSDGAIATAIQAAVNSAVSEYIKWQAGKIGRDIEPGKLVELCMAAGAKRVAVTYPAYTAIADSEIPSLGTQTVTYGGLEND